MCSIARVNPTNSVLVWFLDLTYTRAHVLVLFLVAVAHYYIRGIRFFECVVCITLGFIRV